jgi:hypothetical protein
MRVRRQFIFKPSIEALVALRDNCERKAIENSLSKGRNKPLAEGAIPPPFIPNSASNNAGFNQQIKPQYSSYMQGHFQANQPGMAVIGAPALAAKYTTLPTLAKEQFRT